MTQFANTPGIPKEDADKLFAAGVSFLSNKAFSSAYVCFDRIPAKDFKLLYNKALCCFMVEWYDECHRLLCEAERLVPMNAGHGTERLPEAFIHYLHDEDLKAEAACKQHLYGELKAISFRLGGKYKHIETLINTQNDNDNQ